MIKIQAILVTLGLIITMISGVGMSYFNTTDDIKNTNTVKSENIVIADENIVSRKNQIEAGQEKIDSNESENVAESKHTEIVQKETKTEITSQEITSNQVIPKTQNETVTKKKEEKADKQEQKNESIVETSQEQETLTTKTITPSDLEYWCVSGGSHHIAGDSNNEHGYYKSWDEAYKAFENYTRGWASVQFKISQCPCGLYYFWAIQ